MTIFKKLIVCCLFAIASIFPTSSIANAAISGEVCVWNNLRYSYLNPKVDFYIIDFFGNHVGISGFLNGNMKYCLNFALNPLDVVVHYTYEDNNGSLAHTTLHAKDVSGWGDIKTTVFIAIVDISFTNDDRLYLTVTPE